MIVKIPKLTAIVYCLTIVMISSIVKSFVQLIEESGGNLTDSTQKLFPFIGNYGFLLEIDHERNDQMVKLKLQRLVQEYQGGHIKGKEVLKLSRSVSLFFNSYHLVSLS